MKEIRIRPLSEETDYQSKLGYAIRFLGEGNHVKLIVVFRGREIAHPEIGEKMLLRFAKDLLDYGKAELPPAMDGRIMFLMVIPKIIE